MMEGSGAALVSPTDCALYLFHDATAFNAGRTDLSHGVAYARKVEVPHPHRRNHLTDARALSAPELLELVEHDEWTLVPAEVLDGPSDLALLDQPQPVPR